MSLRRERRHQVGGELDAAVTTPYNNRVDRAVEGLELGDLATEEEGGGEGVEGEDGVCESRVVGGGGGEGDGGGRREETRGYY